jgi:hypothetical protein
LHRQPEIFCQFGKCDNTADARIESLEFAYHSGPLQ